ncbi:MAG: L-glutamate gamma-semialdehyde dehydrogenase [Deltaproteobacteria bacterium]|nr:L-glutamate gamma-semialdehyde dehydrogenase [Deltaproteobacteria bacterium]
MNDSIFYPPEPQNEPVRSYKPGSDETRTLKEAIILTKSAIEEIPLVIGSRKIFDRPKSEITCPHEKNHILASVAQANADDIHGAIDSCLAARKNWAALPWNERASVFLKAASLVTGKYRDKINAATMLGQSKTCYQSEIEAACELADFLRFNAWFVRKMHEDQPLCSPDDTWNYTEIRPVEGFIFAIAPFNFTAIALNLACAPALVGCSVLWKPAPTAVLSSWIGFQILEEAGLPPGVINFVNGDAELIGNIALKHRDLGGVHFTGSTQTFQHIWSEIGKNIKEYRSYPRIVGETGGKDFVFAHHSADIDQLLTALIRGAFEYQGQKCSAASRAYIPRSIWPELRDKLVSEINKIAVGSPENFSNFMAAVIDEKSFEKIRSYIDYARSAQDAEIICGGKYDQSVGYFIWPTLIETNNPYFRTMTEEIFGPVLTVWPYDDEDYDKVISICESSTDYALTGAIFAKNREVISQLSRVFENCAGNFYINDKPTGAVVGQQPFGGARRSGTNDKAGSILNLYRWVSMRTVKENFNPASHYRYPHMGE